MKDQETRGRYRLHVNRTTMKALPSADFFTGSLDGPFIDTDEDTDRGRIYVSQSRSQYTYTTRNKILSSFVWFWFW